MNRPLNIEQLRAIVSKISYPGYRFVVENPADPWLQIICDDGVDTTDGVTPVSWKSRKWKLSVWSTNSEIVQTAWAAVQRALIHEASELFKYKHQAIFDRHLSVDVVAELMSHHGREYYLDGRDEVNT